MRFIIHTTENIEVLKETLVFHLIPIPEMVDNTFLILCERETADLILTELTDYEIIGSWNRKGDFYDDYVDDKDDKEKKPKEDDHKFKKAKYKSKLKQKLNEDGDLVDADENTLIVNIAGWNRINISEDEV